MKNTAPTQKEDKIKIDKFAHFIAEIRQATQKIEDLQIEIDEKKATIKEINKELEALIEVSVHHDRHHVSCYREVNPSHIPSKGIVPHILKYLKTQDGPMTTEEIFQAVKSQTTDRKKLISRASIRSYLSNLNCFESIKKKDVKDGRTSHKKAGWILNKEALKQD